MPELIDKAKVMKYLTPRIKTETTYGEGYNKALEDSAALVALMPTIEAEPVRNGRWIPNGKKSVFGDLEYICSECNRKITANWAVKDPSEYNAFCSGCGARMSATDTNAGGKGGDDNG